MIPAGDDAGLGPFTPPVSDDSAHLRGLVESERVVGSEEEIDDAFAALAALLLDTAQSQRNQGVIPTPIVAPIRPDARRQAARQAPSPAGGEAA